MKVSIIIPIFNSEQYIAKTLDCLLNQTHKDLEIICVLDKPIDNSEKIIRSIKDSRIKIISQKKNMGPGIARNIGVDAATGDWIHFMDSDDLISFDFYEKMLARKDDAQVVACNVFYEQRPKHSIWLKSQTVSGKAKWNKTEVLIHGWLWRYLIRRDFWQQNNLAFPGLSVMEDMPTMVAMIHYAKTIALCGEATYFYKNRATSIVNTFNEKKRSDWLTGRAILHKFMNEHKIRRPNRLMYLIKRI